MSEPRAAVLPVYFVADESNSMAPVIPELNNGLRSLHQQLQPQSAEAAAIRFAIIGFADDAICYMEPTDMSKTINLPELTPRGSTSYSAAFAELRRRIPTDVKELKSQHLLVHRPAVFFLTDGHPNKNDNWREKLDELKASEFREHPNILAFGIGEADDSTISEVASEEQYAFMKEAETDTGAALKKFFSSLTRSILQSGDAIASGHNEVYLDKPEGFRMATDIV